MFNIATSLECLFCIFIFFRDFTVKTKCSFSTKIEMSGNTLRQSPIRQKWRNKKWDGMTAFTKIELDLSNTTPLAHPIWQVTSSADSRLIRIGIFTSTNKREFRTTLASFSKKKPQRTNQLQYEWKEIAVCLCCSKIF